MTRFSAFTAATRMDRRPRFAPRVEALEDRLPPGDVLLGALFGGPLSDPGLLAGGAARWIPEGELAGKSHAAHRQDRPDYQAAGEPDPTPVHSVAPRGGPGTPAQGPAAGGLAGGAWARPTSTPAADEWFASVFVNPVHGAGSIGRAPAGVAPESLAPAPGGEPTGAAAGQAVNGRPQVAPPSGAQDRSDPDALRYLAGLTAAPRAGGAAPAELSFSPQQQASAVHARFDLFSGFTADSPFPSNRWTEADVTQNTGRRINLPPRTNSFDAADVQVLNELDGFNLQPRLSIPFDGPIDVGSVTSQTVFLVRLGDTLDPADPGGQIVGINQVVWDQLSNTLHVESDELLDQHTRYGLIVTNGVLDADGQPVQASQEFARFRHDLNFGQTKDPALKEYRKDLLAAVEAAESAGVPASDIVTASVFTTQSTTAVLEKLRDQVKAAPSPAVNSPTVFNLSEVTSITWRQHTGWTRQPTGELVSRFTNASVPLAQLRIIPDAVGQVAYGSYASPDYLHPGEYIPAVGTRTGTPAAQGTNTIQYTLYLPSVRPSSGRWPVAIWIHGGGGSKEGAVAGVQLVAATLAAKGIASIGINVVGHGSGPDSTLALTRNVGGTVTTVPLPEGGRGIDQNGDLTIGSSEGFEAASPRSIISSRDGRMQTVADLMQLVRVIEAGVDVDADGTGDLDPSRVYYAGASLGGFVGAPFLAVEPNVRAGVLNAVGGPGTEIGRFRPSRGDLAADLNLAGRGLLNAPGVVSVDGLAVRADYFNENKPLRDGVPLTVGLTDGKTYTIQSPMYNTVDGTRDGAPVPGAMAIQGVFDNWEWVTQPGNAVAYAPYLRKDPLPGVPAKPVIIQFAKGDQNVENPTTTALLRAGGLADRATYYRYDLAYAESQQKGLPQPPAALLYPHTFGGLIINANPIYQAVARGAQEQIAVFLDSDGAVTIQPPLLLPPGFRQDLFETPIQGPLPEGLNYIIP